MIPAVTGPVSSAQAAVNVSVNFDVFYNGMSTYGDWVSFGGAYVWVPTSVGPRWRPYTLGHWVWTGEYGWMWVSDEPFGWAAYHYGRWGYSNEFGWYWVPGRRWAPAWVSWRNTDSDIGWAPLPPESDETVVNINVNTLPDYYWNVVPARRFLAPSISAALIFDIGARRRLFQSGRPGGNVIIRNNVVVNNFIDVNFVSKRTGQNIRPVRLVKSDKPGNAMLKGDQVTAFVGDVGRDNNVKPVKIVDVNKVKVTVKDRVRAGRPVTEMGLPDNGNAPNGAAAGQGNGQTGQPDNANKKLGKPKKKILDQNGQPVTTDQTGQPNTGGASQGTATGADQTSGKPSKKKLPKDQLQQNGAGSAGQALPGNNGQAGAAGQSGGADQTQIIGAKKNKKKPILMNGTDQTGQGIGNAGGGTSGDVMPQPKPNKRNKVLMQQNNGGMNQTGQAPNGNGQIQRKLKKVPPNAKPAKCDPQTDPTCPPTLN
jgi:hypothetical protein